MPLPFAPRPFADEALGSWIGRLAARYRIGVLQLDADYELQLGLTGPLAWLVPAAMSSGTLERLCWLTRFPPHAISALEATESAVNVRSVLYCRRCVFLNPLEVESPYWKRDWLLTNVPFCTVHKERLIALPAGRVRACANMLELIRAVSKYEKWRKERGLRQGIGTNYEPIRSI
jgi:hypothetical protein